MGEREALAVVLQQAIGKLCIAAPFGSSLRGLLFSQREAICDTAINAILASDWPAQRDAQMRAAGMMEASGVRPYGETYTEALSTALGEAGAGPGWDARFLLGLEAHGLAISAQPHEWAYTAPRPFDNDAAWPPESVIVWDEAAIRARAVMPGDGR